MLRLLLPLASLVTACTPSPQKAAMPDPSTVPATAAQSSVKPEQSTTGSMPPVAQAKDAVANPLGDSPAEAVGRQTLSTAFVRLGPDGHLTVELRGGQTVVLRDVVMRPKDYCGVQVGGGKYCGGYAEVAAARPGGGSDHPGVPDPKTIEPVDGPLKGK